jgi:hypothetical protein
MRQKPQLLILLLIHFGNHQIGWNNVLNNFRLIIQPILLLWLIFPWLEVFPNSSLLLGFHYLIDIMNQFQPFFLSG